MELFFGWMSSWWRACGSGTEKRLGKQTLWWVVVTDPVVMVKKWTGFLWTSGYFWSHALVGCSPHGELAPAGWAAVEHNQLVVSDRSQGLIFNTGNGWGWAGLPGTCSWSKCSREDHQAAAELSLRDWINVHSWQGSKTSLDKTLSNLVWLHSQPCLEKEVKLETSWGLFLPESSYDPIICWKTTCTDGSLKPVHKYPSSLSQTKYHLFTKEVKLTEIRVIVSGFYTMTTWVKCTVKQWVISVYWYMMTYVQETIV